MKNLLPLHKINTRFAMLVKMEKFKRKDVISITQIKNLMKDICQFIIAMLEKMFEKSILGSLVKDANIFNPDLQLEISKDKVINHLKVPLNHFMTLNFCNPKQCDKHLLTFRCFITMNCNMPNSMAVSFKKMKIILMIFMLKNCMFYHTKTCPLLSKLS